MKKIDFHSHIIPDIDDGAKDIETSIKMMEHSFAQGVDCMIATPHFKALNKDIDAFLHNRNEKLKEVLRKSKENSALIPEIILGAEVAVCPGISEFENLNLLCIENTDYILLEMPYSYWYDAIFDEIYKIRAKRGLIPVIAHVERYSPKKTGYEQYDKFLAMGLIMQVNASSFCTMQTRKRVVDIIESLPDGHFLLGSDCHDLLYRKTQFEKACKKITKIFGEEFMNNVFSNAENAINNKNVDAIL